MAALAELAQLGAAVRDFEAKHFSSAPADPHRSHGAAMHPSVLGGPADPVYQPRRVTRAATGSLFSQTVAKGACLPVSQVRLRGTAFLVLPLPFCQRLMPLLAVPQIPFSESPGPTVLSDLPAAAPRAGWLRPDLATTYTR